MPSGILDCFLKTKFFWYDDKEFPSIPIITEEQADPRITASTFFTVDPLDNTKAYKAGFPYGWGIIVGFVQDYNAQAGVICLPTEDELIVAEKHKGCFRNERPWRLSYDTPFNLSTIGIEIGPWLDIR